MIDKVQKIREEVARLKLCTMDEHMKFYSECAEAEYNALCKVEEIIDSLQEEPVSKVWHDASEEPEFYKEFAIVSTDNVLTASYTLTNHGMSWNGIKEIDKVSKWCYVEDLIYKQEGL